MFALLLRLRFMIDTGLDLVSGWLVLVFRLCRFTLAPGFGLLALASMDLCNLNGSKSPSFLDALSGSGLGTGLGTGSSISFFLHASFIGPISHILDLPTLFECFPRHLFEH